MKRSTLALLLAVGLTACQTKQGGSDVDQAWDDCQLEGEGRPDQAQLVHDSCTRVIGQSDETHRVAAAYNNRSLVLLYWGRSSEAIADLTKAIELKPDRSAYFHNRGRAYSRRGEFEKASADFQKALRLKPDNEWARNNYAWYLAELGEYQAAWPQTEKAVASDPESSIFADTKAHVLMGLGNVSDAEAAFAKSMALGGAEIVRQYQAALARKGYAPGRQDGVLDEATQAALSACVRDNCRLLLD